MTNDEENRVLCLIERLSGVKRLDGLNNFERELKYLLYLVWKKGYDEKAYEKPRRHEPCSYKYNQEREEGTNW